MKLLDIEFTNARSNVHCMILTYRQTVVCKSNTKSTLHDAYNVNVLNLHNVMRTVTYTAADIYTHTHTHIHTHIYACQAGAYYAQKTNCSVYILINYSSQNVHNVTIILTIFPGTKVTQLLLLLRCCPLYTNLVLKYFQNYVSNTYNPTLTSIEVKRILVI